MRRWLLLLLIVAAALALVVVPVLLIQPFRAQTPRSLEVGYAIKNAAPWATLALAAAGLLLLLVPPAGAALFCLYHAVQPASFQAALWGAGGTPAQTFLGALSLYALVAPVYLVPGLPIVGFAGMLALRPR